MKKIAIAAVLLLAPLAFAQQGSSQNPVVDAVRKMVPRQQKNLIGAAEEMPADKYSYKPTDKQMTFGHLVAHMVQSNDLLCSKLSGAAAPEGKISESDGKDKLVAALKQSFDFCNGALGKVQDSELGQPVELWGGMKADKAFALIGLTNDWADHYSAAAMYLRLNGMLPPSAQRQTASK
jgi:uncharacterized damage-inducible protein DinB